MKQISFEHLQQANQGPTARNSKEQLINEIAEQCLPEKERATIRRRLAIAANTAGWTEMDLHALKQKRLDPAIRNYTAFVKWSTKIHKKS